MIKHRYSIVSKLKCPSRATYTEVYFRDLQEIDTFTCHRHSVTSIIIWYFIEKIIVPDFAVDRANIQTWLYRLQTPLSSKSKSKLQQMTLRHYCNLLHICIVLNIIFTHIPQGWFISTWSIGWLPWYPGRNPDPHGEMLLVMNHNKQNIKVTKLDS